MSLVSSSKYRRGIHLRGIYGNFKIDSDTRLRVEFKMHLKVSTPVK